MSAYTTVTHTSWFSRIKSALAGLIIGPICIILAVWLLWYNEGRAVERAQDLKLGAKLVQEIPADTYDAQNDSKLVHISAPIVGGELRDASFWVALSGALLERRVEMYQWSEKESSQTKEDFGGSTTTTKTYSYEKVWSERLIDASRFAEQGKYTNPTDMRYSAQSFQDTGFMLGAFRLSQDLLSSLPTGKTLNLGSQTLTLGTGMTLQGDTIFIGNNPATPEIGDMKITYRALQNGEVLSVIAAQNPQAILSPYQAKNKTLERISLGTHTAQEMFSQMTTENIFLTWGLRVAGLLLMFVGFSAFFGLLPILWAVVPFIGKIIGFGVGFIALLLTLALGGTVIILAWIVARPFFAIGGAVLLIALLVFLWKQKKSHWDTIQAPIPTI